MNCDLCGKLEERLQKALIEGVQLDVCTNCGKFGNILGPAKTDQKQTKKASIEPIKEEKLEMLVEDYSSIIRKKRESLNMTQKEFASKLSEKESTVHKIEAGAFQPSLSLSRKLEKLLGIKIIEEYSDKTLQTKKGKDEGFTLGDFIKIKN